MRVGAQRRGISHGALCPSSIWRIKRADRSNEVGHSDTYACDCHRVEYKWAYVLQLKKIKMHSIRPLEWRMNVTTPQGRKIYGPWFEWR